MGDGGFEELGNLVSKYLQKKGLRRTLQEDQTSRAWVEVVGQEVAAHAMVRELKGKTLVVEVDSAPRLQELKNFHSEDYRKRLNEKLGAETVGKIQYRHSGTRK